MQYRTGTQQSKRYYCYTIKQQQCFEICHETTTIHGLVHASTALILPYYYCEIEYYCTTIQLCGLKNTTSPTSSAITNGPRQDHANRISPLTPLCKGDRGTRAAQDQL